MSFRELIDNKDRLIRYQRKDPEDKLIESLGDVGMPVTHDDLEYIEHRIYHDYVGTVDHDIKDQNHEPDSFSKQWVPYE